MLRAGVVASLFLSLGGMLLAQDAAKAPGLAYLIEGASRIYVVDESRCSAAPDSKEGGRWYLIEGDEKLGRLRKDLSEVAVSEKGGCLCGGPDVHFYAAMPSGETRYFGLDCERFLDWNAIPSSLQALLVPSRPTFIGTRKGDTYIVDIPLDAEEAIARQRFTEAGFTLVVGGRWNMATEAFPREEVLRQRSSATAPVHIEVEAGPFKPIRPEPVLPKKRTKAEETEWKRAWFTWQEENEASTTRSARERLGAWVERLGLQGALLGAVEPRFSMSSGDETTYRADLLFNDAEAVRKALGAPGATQEGLRVKQADYRSAQEMQAKFYYQAALLLPESPPREMLVKAEHVLPDIRRIVPLCDCREEPARAK
jgi:hypothetical protein